MARQARPPLAGAFVPGGPLAVGLDDAIARRWGMRLAPGPRAGIVWGVPFLTC